ncbi:hypothetical protein MAY63_24975, partial [Escherichia coli]
MAKFIKEQSLLL